MTAGVDARHPRHESLRIRERLVRGVECGVTSLHGLIAHGRGEALDYLLGERTHEFAERAIDAAAALLVSATSTAVSVNGNAAALVPEELVALASTLGAPLEVNLFHAGTQRERAIAAHLKAHGAKDVLLPDGVTEIAGIASPRRLVNADGIAAADAVFVPLEDGDRCAALRSAGKAVVTVDLNPLSRTARSSTVCIVDNVVRAMPRLIEVAREMRQVTEQERAAVAGGYDNAETLRLAETTLRATDTSGAQPATAPA